jgi:hypothetical protein
MTLKMSLGACSRGILSCRVTYMRGGFFRGAWSWNVRGGTFLLQGVAYWGIYRGEILFYGVVWDTIILRDVNTFMHAYRYIVFVHLSC